MCHQGLQSKDQCCLSRLDWMQFNAHRTTTEQKSFDVCTVNQNVGRHCILYAFKSILKAQCTIFLWPLRCSIKITCVFIIHPKCSRFHFSLRLLHSISSPSPLLLSFPSPCSIYPIKDVVNIIRQTSSPPQCPAHSLSAIIKRAN